MSTYAFVIPHYASNLKHQKLLERCVESIRKTHSPTTPIYIIDSHSPLPIRSLDIIIDSHIWIHKNPYPNAGEIGALYWFARNAVAEVGILLHDSMCCVDSLEPYVQKMQRECVNIQFLWHFSSAFHYHHTHILQCFQHMDPTPLTVQKRMAKLSTGGVDWHGCFGSSLIVSQPRLKWYAETLHVFKPLPFMNEKCYREAYERILGILFFSHEQQLMSVCGNIYNHVFKPDEKVQDMSFEELRSTVANRGYQGPVVKIWVGR